MRSFTFLVVGLVLGAVLASTQSFGKMHKDHKDFGTEMHFPMQLSSQNNQNNSMPEIQTFYNNRGELTGLAYTTSYGYTQLYDSAGRFQGTITPAPKP